MGEEKDSVTKVAEERERQSGAQKSGGPVKVDVAIPAQEARPKANVGTEVGFNVTPTMEGVAPSDSIRVGNVMVKLGGGQVKTACAADSLKAGPSGVAEAVDNSQHKGRRVYLRKYRSVQDDREWASTGVVATIASGDVTPVVRSRVKDAGFTDVDILHLGADRVFVRHVEGWMWRLLENAREFFDMIFSHWERWDRQATPFQWGAWVRLYGIPLHAWNEKFFKLCVFDRGRFLRADIYTVEKDRLKFARVLIATSSLEVVKRVERLLVDDVLVDVQVIEEWGFNMGDDASLLMEDLELEAPLSDNEEDHCHPEASIHAEKLAEDFADRLTKEAGSALHQEGVANKVTVCYDKPILSEKPEISRSVCQNFEDPKVKGSGSQRARSCPPGAKDPSFSGPWSRAWLQGKSQGEAWVGGSLKKGAQQQGRPGGERRQEEHEGSKKRKMGGLLPHSVFSLKRIVRLSGRDRKEVLRILQKNARRDKGRGADRSQREAVSKASAVADTSSASVNNDWHNWMAMQGSAKKAAADVAEVGKSLGVFVKADLSNMFSVLSKAGKGKHSTSVSSESVAVASEKVCVQ
jgi:hypothetical protein